MIIIEKLDEASYEEAHYLAYNDGFISSAFASDKLV